jgi:hypothetical protein
VCERERESKGEGGGGREYYAIKPPTLPFHLFEVSVKKLSIILFY